jgi:hypothetical protein
MEVVSFVVEVFVVIIIVAGGEIASSGRVVPAPAPAPALG